MSETNVSAPAAPVESSQPSVNEQSSAPKEASSSQSLESQVQEAKDNGASKEEIQNMIEEFELKVNGKQKKVQLDLKDKKKITEILQKAEAFGSTSQELAEMKKMLQNEILAGKKDPIKFMRDVFEFDDEALDVLAESRIQQKIEQLKKSPEQLEKERIQQELEAERARRKKLEDDKHYEQEMRMRERFSSDISKQLIEALDNHPKLPKTQKTARRIVDALIMAYDKGYPEATVTDVIPLVEKEIYQEQQEFLDNLSEEAFEEYIGKKNLEKWRKARMAKIKKAPSQELKDIKPSAPAPQKEEKPVEKQKMSDFFKNLR